MSALNPGDRIHNYLLEEPLGQGSFGEVWRARHHIFEQVVAVKVPTDPQYVRNLQREGLAIHGLHHPNVVRAIDLDPYATPPYLIMEFVDGPSLREVINRYGRTLPVPAAIRIMRGILLALEAAHGSGLVHRDVKPANVLIAQPMERMADVTEACVKVTDFGLGKVGRLTTESMMQSGSLLTEDGRSISGTLAYMAPEQKDGADADGQSDLYSCGIVLFELLTGERPAGNDLPSALRSDAPPYLDQVFSRSYTRKERRFASATEMLEALEAGEAGKRVQAVPPPLPGAGRTLGACPSCGSKPHADDQFCIACGFQLVESVPRCSVCRAYVHRNDRYCVFCGNDLRVLSG